MKLIASDADQDQYFSNSLSMSGLNFAVGSQNATVYIYSIFESYLPLVIKD